MVDLEDFSARLAAFLACFVGVVFTNLHLLSSGSRVRLLLDALRNLTLKDKQLVFDES